MKRINKLAFIFFVFLYACGGNECQVDNVMCEANGLDENYCPKVDSSITPLDKPLIRKVNIFLETSGSMAGYMPNGGASTEFQKLIPDIVERLNSQYSGKINFYSIFDSKTAFKKLEIGGARKNILNGDFSWSGSTYLPQMLDSATKNYLNNDVINIFISDCIYSPETKDSKELELVTTDIRSITKPFAPIFSTTVFCFYSEFRSKKFQSSKSPYYLVLQGKPENNQEIEKIVNKSLYDNNQKFEVVNFGLKYNQPYYSILPYTDKSPNFIANPCANFQGAFVNVMVPNWNPQSDSMNFWIGIDLKNYPDYATTQNYLDTNLILKMDHCNSKIISITNQLPKGLEKDDKPISDKSTHYIHIGVSQIDDCISSLHLSLRFSKPNWIKALNGEESENNREKTFGLEKMINGFDQAYNPNGKANFFNNLTVSIIKQ